MQVTLRNLADCYFLLGKSEKAKGLYQLAIQQEQNDTNSLYKVVQELQLLIIKLDAVSVQYAMFLDATGEVDEAEKHYKMSLQADPRHSNCLCVYADFLWEQRCAEPNLVRVLS